MDPAADGSVPSHLRDAALGAFRRARRAGAVARLTRETDEFDDDAGTLVRRVMSFSAPAWRIELVLSPRGTQWQGALTVTGPDDQLLVEARRGDAAARARSVRSGVPLDLGRLDAGPLSARCRTSATTDEDQASGLVETEWVNLPRTVAVSPPASSG